MPCTELVTQSTDLEPLRKNSVISASEISASGPSREQEERDGSQCVEVITLGDEPCHDMERRVSMTLPSEDRFRLLTRLVWEMRAVPASTVLVFPYYAEPVLFVPCRDGHSEPVLAVVRDGCWGLVWRGRALEGATLHRVARLIAAEAAA
ncbi:hypothetical protein [Actinomadura gamaensis]|uniref:Uncharacterized protein n=1 Tax=Actinomadura gamaensis TaxID=1763541 RepID=A0ABV9U0Z6_9ACTN